MLLFLNKYYCCWCLTTSPRFGSRVVLFFMKNVTFIPGNYRVPIPVLLLLALLGVSWRVQNTAQAQSKSMSPVSVPHRLSSSVSIISFLMISDDFSFRTRIGPQVTSSTPIRIPRCHQMAPRGPFWVTLGSLGITFCPLGLLLGAS